MSLYKWRANLNYVDRPFKGTVLSDPPFKKGIYSIHNGTLSDFFFFSRHSFSGYYYKSEISLCEWRFSRNYVYSPFNL